MHYPLPLLKSLEDAIVHGIWKKSEIKRLFIRCGVSIDTIEGHEWDPMRRAIFPILDYLNSSKNTKAALDKIIENMLAYTDGDHLLWMTDGQLRKAEAEKVLAKLRISIQQLEKAQVDKRKIQEARELNQQLIHEQIHYNNQLASIKQKFIACAINSNLQARGYEFEAILNELFTFFNLMPKKPFRRRGEQIDGAFIHQHQHFLLEAKWREKPSDLNDLRDLDGAVRTSLDNTLGLFIAMNGCSQEALDNYIIGDRPKLICMNGEDIMYVLEGQIALSDLLTRKIDCAVHKRIIQASAKKILAGQY